MDEFKIRRVPRPWNNGKLVGQKTPIKLNEIWAIRVRLQVFSRKREWALFDIDIDSKLRACDLLKLKVRESLSRRAGRCTSDRGATKDFETGTVRDHGVDAQCFSRVDPAVRCCV
jgi:hypothetical protein